MNCENIDFHIEQGSVGFRLVTPTGVQMSGQICISHKNLALLPQSSIEKNSKFSRQF